MNNTNKNSNNENISSAEITAYMRSQCPELSHDNISHLLVSPEGMQKFRDFTEGFSYPLATQKIIVRAGYFYEKSLDLLETGEYDSCISFASGFSMLTYLLAKNLNGNINFIDVDLENILQLRKNRISAHKSQFDQAILQKIETKSFNINDITHVEIKDLFPSCKRPLFILEGISYFLDAEIVTKLIKQIINYDKSAIMIDYWPENSLEISAIFKRIMVQLQGFIAEDLKSFVTKSQIDIIKKSYNKFTDLSICDVDAILTKKIHERPVLVNQNEVFPIRIILAS